MREQGREVVMIGHKGHPEVEGTMGQSDRTACTWWRKSADVAALVGGGAGPPGLRDPDHALGG